MPADAESDWSQPAVQQPIRQQPMPAQYQPAQAQPQPAQRPVAQSAPMPAQAYAAPVAAPAVSFPATPMPSDPTRASLAAQAQATNDDLWFLAPQPAAGERADEAEGEEGGSTISTLFWTVMTGLLVVALVLAFLHFLTGVFR
jgi:hypothetical protein